MDDLSKKSPEDPTKINLSQQWEIDYWCKALGVSEKELRDAVKAVGNSTAKVKQHLGV